MFSAGCGSETSKRRITSLTDKAHRITAGEGRFSSGYRELDLPVRDGLSLENATTVTLEQNVKNASELTTEPKGAPKNGERQELLTDHYELSPLMEKALHSEIDLLMAKVSYTYARIFRSSKRADYDERCIRTLDLFQIWKQFPDAPPTEVDRIIVDRYKNKCGDDFRHALGLNVAQRILNIHHPFYVKVQFSELPRGRTISGFVRKYNIGKFERVSRNKRTTAKNTFKGSVSSFRDFDRLCKLKQMEYDGVKVHVSSYYAFIKCPFQLKFNRVTKEIESQTDPKEVKRADQSNSESESVDRSIDAKDDPVKKEINIVAEFKVDKGDDKKDENAPRKSIEVASKVISNEGEQKPAQVKIEKEEKIEEKEDNRERTPVRKEVKEEETSGKQKIIEDEDAVKKAGGKLNTAKDNVTQSDLDEKEFEDILKNSIILDECIASDDD
ncbi:hypothetical protein EVAR_12148_1 [Eumeta japonica]|uniref:Uncharacterized protein n=1 Tax=Eumeta variegata TaxID=151549 RepID=A0A4C1UGV6_EUMVA|nr:hypothetical protein EVAR_12148_1 [Eumeta japonica]